MTDPKTPSDAFEPEDFSTQPEDVTSTEAAPPSEDTSDVATGYQYLRDFENQTLADLAVGFVRAPRHTWQTLQTVIEAPRGRNITTTTTAVQRPEHRPQPTQPNDIQHEYEPTFAQDSPLSIENPAETEARQNELLVLALRITVILMAWAGNTMVGAGGLTGNASRTANGVWFLVTAILAWLAVDIFANWDGLTNWFTKRRESEQQIAATTPDDNAPDYANETLHPVRIILFIIGAGASILTVPFTTNNTFTLFGFLAWMVSIMAFAGALASHDFLFSTQPIHRRIPPFWKSGTFYALLAIVLVGLFFRTYDLSQTPPQMTSDHVEKLLDSQRVLDGNPQVFFPNNGGREAFQMYAMALFSRLPGLGMDFTTLKLLSALEGVITLPFLWWMGRSLVGREKPHLGNIVGLTLAALVAVSGWHTAVSRLALRIILTPFITAWLLVYLGRAMRDNHRDDYLKAGLVLGAGLYMYQAVRMLPVVVTVGIVIAVAVNARSWRQLRDYAVNFAALVFISFIVFVPLFSFSMQNPDLFWRRTTGRLLGDALVEEIAEDGSVTTREASWEERLDAFEANLPILQNNINDVLLMFNYRGDVAWINNAPNAPHMSNLVGALLVVGLGAWTVRIIRLRDPVDLLIPLACFIMLLPSALSIAYPVENPSATRTSGALPIAYLLAAYPLALLVDSIWRLISFRRVAAGLSVILVGLVMTISLAQNSETYFQRYHNNYLLSSLPYDQAGRVLSQFNTETNTRGNAFMIASPYWWDHRALGLEAGMVDFPNGIIDETEVPQFLYDSSFRQGPYQLNPNQDLLFFFSLDDIEALQQLQVWFPDGTPEFTTISEQNRSYATYRVPAPGMNPLNSFFRDNGVTTANG